ncbi:MAG: DNA alkylation repair protein [Candidatus Hodarchaeales archaeon]|jgi:hypothetical protein
MKLKVSNKNKERYTKEDKAIQIIRDELAVSSVEKARELLEIALKDTEFKTKFHAPEKDLTKYYALKLLEDLTLSPETLGQFSQKLWEKENSSLREIGIFILGHLYSQNPDKYFGSTVELAKLSNTWNDIDNLGGYVIEEHVAKNYDLYLVKLYPLVTHKNKWVRRLAIVSLGRGFFISKKKEHVKKCLETIEVNFTDSRKIVLDANSWIIGTLGFRVDPDEIVRYFERYMASEDPTIIKLFCDVVKRSKLSKELPPALKEKINLSLEQWGKNQQSKSKKSVESALKFLNT